MTFERFFIWPPLTLSGATRSHFGTKLAAFWGDLGRFLDHFVWVDQGHIGDHFGIVLVSFWPHCTTVLVLLGSCLDLFEPFEPVLGLFLRSFCGF